MNRKDIDKLSYNIIGAAIDVHKRLGPGLLEHVYQACLIDELVDFGFKVSSEKNIKVNYRGRVIDSVMKYDILVNDLVVVEIKAVEKILPVHCGQLLTYMRILKKPKGILINFNCTNIFKFGQRTLVNELYSNLPAS
jgi:GxxExxY protein